MQDERPIPQISELVNEKGEGKAQDKGDGEISLVLALGDREVELGLLFAGVNYYDGQGFMVRKKLNVASAKELNGASVCVQQGTTTELNLADYFRTLNMKYEGVVFATADEAIKAYDTGRCDSFTTDVSQLYAERLKLVNPDEHVVLADIISKEPLGPAVRHGDQQFADIVRWTQFAMLEAEENGIDSKNVDAMLASDNPNIRRILGVTPGMGKALGVDEKWVYNIVKQVGNYGESFERNVGSGSPLKIDRGFVVDLETNADARAVVDAVIHLAHALDLRVVAEGVETEGQYDILRRLGCDEMQGYWFAPPMPANQLLEWVMKHQPASATRLPPAEPCVRTPLYVIDGEVLPA